MPEICPLIPPAQAVRERLGQTVREARMLRSLLNLAIKADQERKHGRPDASLRATSFAAASQAVSA